MVNKSVCACIMSDGRLQYEINLNGAYNKITFNNFFKKLNLPKNSIVLLDNIRFHHNKEIVEYAYTQNIILLYIPPYSPWFNPIENIFSVVLLKGNKYRKSKNIQESFKCIKSNMIINSFNSMYKKI
jgi:transposase